jgi:rhodanese-related sulfurtransferase
VALANIECDPQELKERLGAGEDIVLLDVRTDAEVSGGQIPKALHIPLDQLPERWEVVKDANEVVCYCAGGMRSLKAAELLRGHGVFNATSLEGGLGAWTGIGGELTEGSG